MVGRSCALWSCLLGTLSVTGVVAVGGAGNAQSLQPAAATLPVVLRAQAKVADERGQEAPRMSGEIRVNGDLAPAVTRIAVETGRTLFEGVGTPGTLVDLSEGLQVIGVTTVDPAGKWSLVVERPLSPGDHRISTASRDPVRARQQVGQDVLLSIPEGFTGTAVLQRASAGQESVTAALPGEAQRRRAEEMAAAASERFAEIMSSPEWRRVAQAAPGAAGQAMPRSETVAPLAQPLTSPQMQRVAQGPESVLAPVYGWFDRAGRDYHEHLVRRLADPRPISTVPGRTAMTEAPSGPVRTVPAEAPRSPVLNDPGTPAVRRPPPRETSLLEDVQDWLARAGRDYNRGIVKQLEQPTGAAVAAPKAPPLAPFGPGARVPDSREADALRRADVERQEAEARRLVEQRRIEALAPIPAPTSPLAQLPSAPPSELRAAPGAEDRATIEARRLEDERRMAEARRKDEERRAEEARLEAQRRLAEAKRLEDEKRATEQAKADEARRAQETAAREAQRKAEELAQKQQVDRQKQAANTTGQDEARRAQEALQRAEELRRAQEQAAREGAQRQQEAQRQLEAQRLVDQERQAALKAADEQRRAREAQQRATDAARRTQESIVTPPAQLPSGYASEQAYRRAMAEAARAPKDTTSIDRRRQPPVVTEREAPPQVEAPAVRPAVTTTGRTLWHGYRNEAEYRRALVEAARAPKDMTGQVSQRDTAARVIQPPPREQTRQEAERRAQEMLRVERERLADLKIERGRVGSVRAARRPVEVEEGSSPGVAAKVVASRPACRTAGRRVSLPGTYVVKSGDTLWRIAERFYGDGEMYQNILRANKGKLPDPDRIEPCQRLSLPRSSR
jgi:nucleoid-associated protein YgaU